jgi:hypothetical protein
MVSCFRRPIALCHVSTFDSGPSTLPALREPNSQAARLEEAP